MKIGYAFLIATLFAFSNQAAAESATVHPRSQGIRGVSCADFQHNWDGSWTAISKATIFGPRGPFAVEPGEIFRIQLGGTTNYNVPIAEILNDLCR